MASNRRPAPPPLTVSDNAPHGLQSSAVARLIVATLGHRLLETRTSQSSTAAAAGGKAS